MGRMEMMILEIFFSLLLIGFSFMALYLYYIVWIRPEGIRRKMSQQGISGPPPTSFFSGNIEDIKKFMLEKESSRGTITHDYSVFPHFDHWSKDYGMLLAKISSCTYRCYSLEDTRASSCVQGRFLCSQWEIHL